MASSCCTIAVVADRPLPARPSAFHVLTKRRLKVIDASPAIVGSTRKSCTRGLTAECDYALTSVGGATPQLCSHTLATSCL